MPSPSSFKLSPAISGVLITLLLVVCCCRIFGQRKIDPVYVSVSDGLASPSVRCMLQDSYGLIWIGTGNGLQQYDGYGFQTFKNRAGVPTSIANNDVWGVTEDHQHNLWVSHGDGVSKFDRKRNVFRNYSFARLFNFQADVRALSFKTFIDSQGRIWAGTRNVELVLYDPVADTWRSAPYEVERLTPGASHSGLRLVSQKIREEGYGRRQVRSGSCIFPGELRDSEKWNLNSSDQKLFQLSLTRTSQS